MCRLLGLLLAVCLVWAGPAGAETIDGRRLNDLLSGYYRSPDPAAALRWLPQVDPAALQRREAVDIVATFYLHLLRSDPALGRPFVDGLREAPAPAVLAAATAVWLAGLPDRAALLEHLRDTGRLSDAEAAKLTRFPAFDPASFVPVTAHELDLCWVAFYATGDERYVAKVAGHLPYMLPRDEMVALGKRDEPALRQVFERAMVARAAAWSLVSHAQFHPRVLAALQTLAQGQDRMHKAVKALLEDVMGR